MGVPNVWIPYIMISFAGINLTWKPSDNAPDYFTSLSHKRIVDQASTMTINITYAPDYNDDPNMIEKAIVNSKGECYVQYGHIGGWVNKYKYLVYKYVPRFQNGVLNYTFTLISKSVTYNYSSTPAFTGTSKVKTVDDVTTVMNELAACCKDSDGKQGYVYDAGGSSNLFQVPEAGIEVPSNTSPLLAMSELCKKLTPGAGEKKEIFFALEVDDAHYGPGQLRIIRVDPTQPVISRTFNWGTRDGEVLSFSPEFDGSFAIFKARGEESASTVDPNTGKGATVTTPTPDTGSIGSSDPLTMISETIKTDEEWKSKADYEYKASLEVIGQPKALTIGKSVISVNPLIQGKPHHTAGNYVVTGIEDKVDSSGFTTTYTMYKQMSESTVNVYSQATDQTPRIWTNGGYVDLVTYDPSHNKAADA